VYEEKKNKIINLYDRQQLIVRLLELKSEIPGWRRSLLQNQKANSVQKVDGCLLLEAECYQNDLIIN
jgi:hypothetical protein